MPNEQSNPSATNGDWRIVRFGDVVRDIKESERNPLESGLERFLGLDHIEPEQLLIKKWGLLTEEDVSFTKRFRKGQVLFGKRRAYQRKVAVADFDGICSSDILTFFADEEQLDGELLPFVVQLDAFFDHALDTSSGSLSPRTRWSQLKDFEFAIPSLEEQKRIADILWAAEEQNRKLDAACEFARLARNALHRDLLENREWRTRPLGEACEIANRLRKPINATTRSQMQGQYPYWAQPLVLAPCCGR